MDPMLQEDCSSPFCERNAPVYRDSEMEAAKNVLLLRLRRLRTSLRIDIDRVEREVLGIGPPQQRKTTSGGAFPFAPHSSRFASEENPQEASKADEDSFPSVCSRYSVGLGDDADSKARRGRALANEEERIARERQLAHIRAVRLKLQELQVEALAVPFAFADISRLRHLKQSLSSEVASARHLGLPEADIKEAEGVRRRIHNAIEDRKGQLRVYCRVRPFNDRELALQDEQAVSIVDDMTVKVANGGTFTFDGVFAPGSQSDIFEDCRDLVQSAVDGHNVTIFTYGQTGAGKTFTMYGTDECEGIAPRTITEVFDNIQNSLHRYAVKVSGSMVEIYGGALVDLLADASPSSRGSTTAAMQGSPRRSASVPRSSSSASLQAGSPRKLSVRHRAGTVQVDNLIEQPVASAAELRALLDRGIARRAVASSAMSANSSRSHVIFSVMIQCTNRETEETLCGKICLIDLGGSERLKKSEVTGEQRKEAIAINKSLSALGDVIEAVTKRQQQVPYRNDNLTRFLQDSLGGTAKTLMFCNCSPAKSNMHETLMSLRYAMRAKRITNATQGGAVPMLSRRLGGGSLTPSGFSRSGTSTPSLLHRSWTCLNYDEERHSDPWAAAAGMHEELSSFRGVYSS